MTEKTDLCNNASTGMTYELCNIPNIPSQLRLLLRRSVLPQSSRKLSKSKPYRQCRINNGIQKTNISMKTELPERSLHIRGRLNFIMQQILELVQDKIAMIILYGSFA
ncbi:MAG: hypothetical protein ACRYE8_03645 [Janthinobacterium lividum]